MKLFESFILPLQLFDSGMISFHLFWSFLLSYTSKDGTNVVAMYLQYGFPICMAALSVVFDIPDDFWWLLSSCCITWTESIFFAPQFPQNQYSWSVPVVGDQLVPGGTLTDSFWNKIPIPVYLSITLALKFTLALTTLFTVVSCHVPKGLGTLKQ